METMYDLVNVTNITDEDFAYTWDARNSKNAIKGVIKPGETAQLMRFLAEHVAKKIVDKVIIADNIRTLNDTNVRAEVAGRVFAVNKPAVKEPTMAELREQAKEKGVKVKFGAKKEDLQAALDESN